MITHDVEEALTLADRVLVLDGGVLAADLRVTRDRPRRLDDPELRAARDDLLGLLGVRLQHS